MPFLAASDNVLVTQREQTPGVLDNGADPLLRMDFEASGDGFEHIQRAVERDPEGFNSLAGVGFVGDEGQIQGNHLPKYDEIEEDLEDLCGPAISNELIDGGTRRKLVFRFPELGVRELLTRSAFYGQGDQAYELLYGYLTAWSVESNREADTGGNKTYRFNRVRRNQQLIGFVAQSAIARLVAEETNGQLSVAISVADGDPANVLVNPWDTAATVKAAIEAHPNITTVAVTRTVEEEVAKVLHVTSPNPSGTYQINGMVAKSLSDTLTAWRDALRATGGSYTNCTLAGTITAASGGPDSNLALGKTVTVTNGGGGDGVVLTDGNTGGDVVALLEGGTAPTVTVDFGAAILMNKAVLYHSSADYALSVKASATGTFTGEEVTLGSITIGDGPSPHELTFARASYRYLRLTRTGGSETLYLLEIQAFDTLAEETPGELDITVTIPVNATNPNPNLPALVASEDTDATITVQTPSSFTVDYQVTVSNPAQTKVAVSKNSGAGWTTIITQRGSDGNPEIRDGHYIYPDHWRRFKATDKDDLDSINMGSAEDSDSPLSDPHLIATSRAGTFSMDSLATAVYLENGQRAPASHVDQKPNITATITLPKDKDRCEEIYATDTNPEGHPGAVPFFYGQRARCGMWEFWIDLYSIRNEQPAHPVENNLVQQQFSVKRHYYREGSLIFTVIKPV